ncbi:hypothetical protein DKM44_13545 [Deinococcus irradiatisoli]|uniref:Tyr recombinase domain-containing protein n=1 Tax=Deinococcus irradiatisoli TaxID=2202254 RepID=A0A2Z3JKQ2_9DEIO|nr:hypothetical protein DKM44_13545 [Deinococcus irradiatisoli]
MQEAGKSAALCAYALRVLKMALRQAVRWQILSRKAAEALRPPKVTRQEMHVWTAEQVAAFLCVSQAHRLHAAFYLALMTGMRRGEVLGLKWEDVDWERSRLKIRNNLVEVRGEGKAGKQHAGKDTVSSVRASLRLQIPKADALRRTVAFSPGTLSKLRRDHQAQQERERLAAAEAWQD